MNKRCTAHITGESCLRKKTKQNSKTTQNKGPPARFQMGSSCTTGHFSHQDVKNKIYFFLTYILEILFDK